MSEEEPQAPKPQPLGVGIGVLIGIGLHLVFGIGGAILVGTFVQDFWTLAVVTVGLSQLVYMAPSMILAHFRGQPGVVKGIAIIAAITFLLNAGCFGLIALGGLGFH